MTIATFFSSLLRPCGADHAPPKSPLHPSSSNQLEQPKSMGVETKPSRIQERVNIDCTRNLDKASTQQGETPKGTDPTPNLVKEKDKDKVTSACAASDELIRVFGIETLHQLHSKAWDDRATALQNVHERVQQSDIKPHTAEEFFAASACVVQVALSDKVMPVYLSALELSRSLVVDFAPQHNLPSDMVERHADAMIPIIVAKTSDRNARATEATHGALISMARQMGCRCIMAKVLLPITDPKKTAEIRGRLELLEPMIDEFGFSKNSGNSLSLVMGWVRPHLEAADEKVRHAAIDVTVSCYSHKGERTQSYVSNLKPALLKLLEQRFAEAGTPNKGKRKSKRRRNAIGAQRQLPALKGQAGQGPQSRASTSTSSSSGRQSNSAGSNGSASDKRLAPLRCASRNSSGSDVRSPAMELPASMRMDSLSLGGDLLAPPAVHGSMDTSVQPLYMDKFGMAVSPSAQHSQQDLFSLNQAALPGLTGQALEEDNLMKEIEGL